MCSTGQSHLQISRVFCVSRPDLAYIVTPFCPYLSLPELTRAGSLRKSTTFWITAPGPCADVLEPFLHEQRAEDQRDDGHGPEDQGVQPELVPAAAAEDD